MKRLSRFLRLGIIFPMPPGMAADGSADFGYFGLLNNLNGYAINLIGVATAGTNTTLTNAQLSSGLVRLTSGASGGFTITLPSTSSIISAMGPTVMTNSTYADPLFIMNDNVGQTGTLTAGDANTTITGTATVATNTTRHYLIVVTSPTTITIYNYGTMAL